MRGQLLWNNGFIINQYNALLCTKEVLPLNDLRIGMCRHATLNYQYSAVSISKRFEADTFINDDNKVCNNTVTATSF